VRRVSLVEFGRHLAEHLRAVACGETLVIARRGRPIVRVEPRLRLRPPLRPVAEIRDMRYQSVRLPFSSKELLAQEHGHR
jgi:antitoxin (DNA-binding transcriptional repressor) of toxin-antitoxin stability system